MRALKPARRRRRGRVSLRVACGSLAAFWAANASADVPDADSLIAGLARDPPATVAFAEARFSALLLAPIIVSGELAYPAPASLDRIVTAPYRERTSIRGDSVTVAREGERARTFALRRAPELRGLLTGFGALLAGDAAAIENDFEVGISGSADAWRLELTPRDDAVKRRLTSLVASGPGDTSGDLRCLVIRSAQDGNAQEGATVMLLGAAAADGIAADATLASLLDRCGAE
jgi:hypothetical protein